MFFNSWESIFKIIILGILTYISFIIMLRISGKRSLSKLNAFDVIVSVALGSILASTITSDSLPLVDGIVAFATLLILQYFISKLSVNSYNFEKLIKSNPVLIFHNGEFLDDVMTAERITKRDLLSILRNDGIYGLDSVQSVVLETDGKFSVIEKSESDSATTMVDVETEKTGF